jgi:hypothetical protein
VSPADAQILIETIEEKIFICNAAGIIQLSTLGSKVKGMPVGEAIALCYAVPHSYGMTLSR